MKISFHHQNFLKSRYKHLETWIYGKVGQGPVVRKLISTNPGLKVNQGFNTLV